MLDHGLNAVETAAAVGALILSIYGAAKTRSYMLSTARAWTYPRIARVGFLLGMLAAWAVQAALIAVFATLVFR